MISGESTPNVVFIITDNQSTWTLGCYGNREILTPISTNWLKRGSDSPIPSVRIRFVLPTGRLA